jgi:hypothetical protein
MAEEQTLRTGEAVIHVSVTEIALLVLDASHPSPILRL